MGQGFLREGHPVGHALQEIKSLLSKHFGRVWIPQISELPAHKVDQGLMMDRWTEPCLGASPPNLPLPTMPAGQKQLTLAKHTDPQTEQIHTPFCCLQNPCALTLSHTPLCGYFLSPLRRRCSLSPQDLGTCRSFGMNSAPSS